MGLRSLKKIGEVKFIVVYTFKLIVYHASTNPPPYGGGNTQAADWDRYDPWSADDLFYVEGKKVIPDPVHSSLKGKRLGDKHL